MTSPLRYRAFISYAHEDDRSAARLHRKLEAFRIPEDAGARPSEAGGHPARFSPVFRDREELATSTELSDSIEAALDASEALIVVASPAAVASRWVGEEIAFFRRRHPDRPVLAFVIAGDPGADPQTDPERAAFPTPLLLKRVDQPELGYGEPMAADARPEADDFNIALLRLLAGLLGVPFDALRRREQRRRNRRMGVLLGLSLVLTTTFALLAWQATASRDEARSAQAQAELELLSERQTRDFLLSIFRLADPGESRGNSITAREVLDTAVQRIDSSRFDRPVVKARFLATMGRAYASLGINRRSTELLDTALAALNEDPEDPLFVSQRRKVLISLADVYLDMGDYDQVQRALDEVFALTGNPDTAVMSHAWNIQGDTFAYVQRDAEAVTAHERALELLAEPGLTVEEAASQESRALGGLARVAFFAGDNEKAQRLYGQAVDLLLPVFGDLHPDSIWALVSWGSAAYAAGDRVTARAAWMRSLGAAERVFDADNPEVGTIKNNLGRLELESGNLDEAEGLLRDTLAIDRKHRIETFDDLVFPLDNLALVRLAQGDRDEARELLEEAHQIATQSNHRMRGPVATDLADVLCLQGMTERGLSLAESGVAPTADTFGDDNWRTHAARLTVAYCRALGGEAVSAEAEGLSPTAAVDPEWSEGSPHALRITRQLAVLAPDQPTPGNTN